MGLQNTRLQWAWLPLADHFDPSPAVTLLFALFGSEEVFVPGADFLNQHVVIDVRRQYIIQYSVPTNL